MQNSSESHYKIKTKYPRQRPTTSNLLNIGEFLHFIEIINSCEQSGQLPKPQYQYHLCLDLIKYKNLILDLWYLLYWVDTFWTILYVHLYYQKILRSNIRTFETEHCCSIVRNVLVTFTWLEELLERWNKFSRSPISPLISKFAKTPSYNPTLTHVELSKCNIGKIKSC